MTARELYEAGRSKMDDCQFKEAIVYLEQSAFSHAHFKTLQLLGVCYSEIGDVNRSIIYLGSAVSLNDQAQLSAQLASALLKSGDFFQKLKIAERALGKEANNKLALAVRNEAKAKLAERGYDDVENT